MAGLSVVMITKNGEETIKQSLESIKDLAKEIIVVDDFSSDNTVKIAREYGAKVFFHKGSNLGRQRKYGLTKANNNWVLFLDSDEVVSPGLEKEIREKVKSFVKVDGYYIPYQNHFLGQRLRYGGEGYKVLRLFKKNKALIRPLLVHERVEIKEGKTGRLENKIYHYSYRSLSQMLRKFTDYAVREAKEKKKKRERSSLKKIFLYPLHMFWARFIKDKGYKDGLFRIPLDLGFAYMEFLTYLLLFLYRLKRKKLLVTSGER